ncbi:MAG: serine hydrolase [Promethearchaeota archaeon]|nr:MAG: serine hydrolase [Candidatus Lokiarchaeota archaeon]
MNDKFDQLHKIIVKLMRKFKVPGLAIDILHNDEIVYEKGFGARNLEENKPMTSDTLIGIGSISKSFTALLILKLREKGLLELEDSVSKHLEIEPFLSNPDITLAHLLSHSSGIPSVDAQWLPIAITYGDYQRIYPMSSEDDYLYHISETKNEIFFKPGEKFFYNNDMFSLLGMIVEKLTRKSFSEVLSEDILTPLEMSRATVKREDLEKDPEKNYITGYIHKGTEEKLQFEKPKLPFSKYLQAPGGIYTSMHEMLNYARCLLHKGVFKDKQIIKSESLDLLWTPQIKSPYGYGKDPKYCLGWVQEKDFLGHTIYHHGGGLGVSTSFFGLIPEKNIAVSVAENDDSGISGLIGTCALMLMLGEDPEKISERLKILDIYEKIAGKYKSSLGLYNLEVTFKAFSIHIKVESDDGVFNFPLIIKDFDNLTFSLFSTVPSSLQEVKFYQNSTTGKVEYVTYDRYLYHKS